MGIWMFSIICTLVLSLLTTLSLLPLAAVLARQLFAHYKALPLITKLSAIATCVLPILGTLCTATLMVCQLSVGADRLLDDSSAIFVATRTGSFLSRILWYFVIYTFMLSRLHSTFKESVYAVPKCTIHVHLANIVWVLIYVLLIGPLIYWYVLRQESLPGILLVVAFVFFAAGYIHLGHAFNHRLFQLVLNQRQTLISADAEDRTLTETQKTMLAVIRKNTLLASILLFMTMVEVCIMFTAALVTGGQYWPLHIYPISSAYLAVFDVVISILLLVAQMCVFLTFKVNEVIYFKLCARCDAKCQGFCEGLAYRKMNKLELVDYNVKPSPTVDDQPQSQATTVEY